MIDADFAFVPGLVVAQDSVPDAMPIKGRLPANSYPVALKSVYPSTPSLDGLSAYKRVRLILSEVDGVLCSRRHLRDARELPDASTLGQALACLGTLFDPTLHGDAGVHLIRPDLQPRTSLMDILEARPFPLQRASTWKLEHTLAWADTNMKLQVEDVAKVGGLNTSETQWLVERALTLYSLVMKQQDYWLARHGSLNHSMFIQERVMDLLFGNQLTARAEGTSGATLTNAIALELLRGFAAPTAHTLNTAAISMGVIWANDAERHRLFPSRPDDVLGDLDTELRTQMRRMPIDDFPSLESDAMLQDSRFVVVLDDNGECVFDVALFQQFMRQNSCLQVVFLTNRWPVSNNIWEQGLLALLEDDYFADLREYIRCGRAQIRVEDQAFRSFELDHLSDLALTQMALATGVYVKGANFFETMQFAEAKRYYAFVAHGDMSVLLTGYPAGAGILACVERGESAFEYHGPHEIRTLYQAVQDRTES